MTARIIIQNLKCSGCANTITKQLNQLDDVNQVNVEVDSGTVQFHYGSERTLEVVTNKLKKLGYPVTSEENGFRSVARSFVSCGLGRLSKT